MYMSFSNPPLVPIPRFELLSRQDDAAEPIFKLYHYDPTIAGAVIFVILFLGTTCFHTYQLWRARTWFMVPLVLGGVCKSPHEVLAETTAMQHRQFVDTTAKCEMLALEGGASGKPTWLTLSRSGVCRLRRPSSQWGRDAIVDIASLHHSSPAHPGGTGVVRSDDIHGTGPHCDSD
jgi:hypothetical protein